MCYLYTIGALLLGSTTYFPLKPIDSTQKGQNFIYLIEDPNFINKTN